jgi:phosphoribosylformylglycinamidine cyclo-ligase
VFFDRCGLTADTLVPELGVTVGDALLAPHRSYLGAIRPLIHAGLIKGMAHITGGGITENLPRVLPAGCAASVDRSAWAVPALFTAIRERGHIEGDEMYRAFNMGIGLVLVCAASDQSRVLALLAEHQPVAMGRVEAGDRVVVYVDG